MEETLKIANSGYFYLWGSIILAVIMVQSILFIRLAWKEGKRIGLTTQRMLKGLRAGMIAAIIPSISIVLFLISMSATLGVPFPWIRLSVIGSAPYELIAAKIGADAMGAVDYSPLVFANSVWIMTIGAMWSGLIVFFFLKVIGKRFKKIENRDPKWMTIITSAAFFGVICIFIAKEITAGALPLLTLTTGAVLMTIFALLITKLNIKWLKEFALPISMLGAMAGAIVFAQMLA